MSICKKRKEVCMIYMLFLFLRTIMFTYTRSLPRRSEEIEKVDVNDTCYFRRKEKKKKNIFRQQHISYTWQRKEINGYVVFNYN